MTTTSNIDSHCKGIPGDRLPKTFQDAIIMAARLEIQHLWIDSLCIVQDSPDDWAKESAQMANIYAAAYVTMAADAAEDCYTGFLRPEGKRHGQATKVECQRNGNYSAVRVRQKGVLAWPLPYHENAQLLGTNARIFEATDDAAFRSKLSTRAWAFQERLLSERTLHFSKSELAWECKSKIACECSATTQRKNRTTSLMKGDIEKRDWWTMVEEYTSLNLTRQEDRMAGIAGLGQAMARLSPGDRYVCGLWKNSLALDLLWHVDTSAKPSERLDQYLAPSWSWGSVNGGVRKMQDASMSQEFRILDIKVDTTVNDFGPIQDAYLKVSGSYIPVRTQPGGILRHSPNPESKVSYDPNLGFHALWDSLNLKLHYESSPLSDSQQNRIYFLWIGETQDAAHGIMLRRRTPRDGFERVGYAYGGRVMPPRRRRGSSTNSSELDATVNADTHSSAGDWREFKRTLAEWMRLTLY